MYFRNKEIRYYTNVAFLLSAVMIAAGFFVSVMTGIMILITVFLLFSLFYLYTYKRYRDIKKLSGYLRRISSGDYTLDIRDNAEGELSILKSEIYKVTLRLIEYNDQLKKEKLLLSEQIAEISHQLKTPMTSMMVMADLLKEETFPAKKRQEFASLIINQLKRMEWLVSSLLKMSKLDAGVVMMKREEVSIQRLIESVRNPFLITMELKEITYTVNTGNLSLFCDFEWTTEALINIIKNCIEHSPMKGHIEISFSDNPLYSEIIITDHGTGISKEDLPHIFNRFYRGKNSSPDSVGIGLAMSYRIIKSQQGDILVKSEQGKGSTFSVRFYKSVV